jgi:hypothetical protein
MISLLPAPQLFSFKRPPRTDYLAKTLWTGTVCKQETEWAAPKVQHAETAIRAGKTPGIARKGRRDVDVTTRSADM